MNGSRSIFITGAASGIGRETALLFARNGWRVGAVDVDEGGLARLAGDIGEDRCLTGRLDVRDLAAYRERIAAFGAWTGGRMDALFNCAGIMRMGPFEQVPAEEHVRTVEVNVIGVLHGIHAAFDLLKATPGSHVVSMGSASGLYGVPDLASYSASKFFIRGLTEALNLEFERHGITVTDLMPLYVDTAMVRSQEYRAGSLKTFGARLTPQQVAGIVWKAVQGKKVHWVPGALLRALNYLGNALPFLSKPTMRLVDRRKG
ncbi:MAG TPA: SDR family oxidoreductase [Thermoanaerobaculia bacterium]|jgi:NAD(P)-dependent dehydrogenase (short-subunit alcohol dehydrogenase family)|nr:SDR family oxidoreductase [Thermoanaerobaculia bacterium]